MNPYLTNLRKVEFVLTYACTGKCRHCSEGDHVLTGERIDPAVAADAVRKIVSVYDIRTVMVFGGEPLLHTDALYAVMHAAKETGVSHRQVITNGFFATDSLHVCRVAKELSLCGVNDLLLSVDAFHQETIPLAPVMTFAEAASACGIPVRLSPAWLVSRTDENPYNRKTRTILEAFRALDIPVGEGNVVFPEGNAKKFLAEYFTEDAPANPYVEDPYDVRCISFAPNGDVLGGNVYKEGILEIMERYAP